MEASKRVGHYDDVVVIRRMTKAVDTWSDLLVEASDKFV